MKLGRTLGRLLGPVAAALLAALSCGAPTGDPVGFAPPDRPVKKVVLYPADVGWQDTYYDVYVPTGQHYRLAAGSWRGFRSRILICYDTGDLPKEVRLTKIRSVSLTLPYERASGSLNDDIYAEGDLRLDVHPLRRAFDEDRATWGRATRKEGWSVEGGDYGPVAASVVLGSPSFQREFVKVDITALALDWVGNPHRNYGLLVKAADEDAAAGLKEFYSTNQFGKGNAPRLEITYTDDEGEKAYKVLLPEKDCFITDYDGEIAGNENHGFDGDLDFGSFNGYGRRVLFYFNLSPGITGIPATASVARARLRLYYVPAGRDERVYVAVYRLTSGFEEGMKQDELELQKYHDNVAYIDREFKSEAPGYVDLFINPLVQEWISGKHPNYGLMIKAPDESAAQAFPRFASRNNSESGRRPYLEIEYTLPANSWYNSPTGNSP